MEGGSSWWRGDGSGFGFGFGFGFGDGEAEAKAGRRRKGMVRRAESFILARLR